MSSPRVPKYHRVADALRAQIRSGELAPGDRLPSESSLAATYKASTPVVRQALDILVGEGLIVKHHGKGSFVREARRFESRSRNRYGLAQRLAALTQFADDVNAANDRYMLGRVSGVTLSTDIHAAVQRLNGEDPKAPGDVWDLKPGDTIPDAFPHSVEDREKAAMILEAAPIGTYVKNRHGERWRRLPNQGIGAWLLHDATSGTVTTTSHYLVSMHSPLTVVSVPHRRRDRP